MVNLRYGMATFICLVTLLSFALTASARRKYDRRRDLEGTPPVSQYGWTVPLEGGKTCEDSTQCELVTDNFKDTDAFRAQTKYITIGINRLPAPPVSNTLQYLAIGRGTITYSCNGRTGIEPPIYIGQNGFLYDAAPLIPRFNSEDQFHGYIPRFLEYDYTSLDNSTLNCIGNVQRIEGLTVFTIYNVDAFAIEVKERINSPNNRQFDLPWVFSQDDGAEWSIYRVETASGGPPYNCGDQVVSEEIPVEYVAEYWFYQRKGNSHEG